MDQDERNEKPIDKSAWGDGPWQTEPDRVEFEHAGLPCLMVRQPRSGHWCGYAAVPPGHPAHGKEYDSLDVNVHGGLTYGNRCSGQVCHVPKPGESDDVFWFGFDCAHSGDISPAYDRNLGRYEFEAYRDAEYVRRETERLAEQLAAIATQEPKAEEETTGTPV